MTDLDITQANLDALVRGFLARTLPKERWTHQAHLLTGMMLGRVLEPEALLPSLRETISAYNAAVGGQNTADAGYHETITAFYAQVLSAYARATLDLPAAEAGRRLMASLLAGREIVFRAYDKDALMASAARVAYRAPDKADFDPDRLVAEAMAEHG